MGTNNSEYNNLIDKNKKSKLEFAVFMLGKSISIFSELGYDTSIFDKILLTKKIKMKAE